MTIKVYKYGLLDPVNGWNQTAIDVLFLRNKLWNNLVALEHERRQAYRNLLLDADTEVAGVHARLDAFEVERVSLITRKNAMRAKARSKQVDTAWIDQEIKNCSKSVKLYENRLNACTSASRLRSNHSQLSSTSNAMRKLNC